MVIFRQGLAVSKSENYLAVGKMRNNFSRAPFARRGCCIRVSIADGSNHPLKACGSFAEYAHRVFIAEIRRIRIHANKVARRGLRPF